MRPNYRPERSGEVKHSLADISEAARDLGDHPAVGVEEGLRLTLDWCRQQETSRAAAQ